MRTDYENLQGGDVIRLVPNNDNPIHKKPGEFTYSQGYYFGKESNPELGPDYYFRDVGQYNEGFEIAT